MDQGQYPKQQIAGIWLPATDTHFEPFLRKSPRVAGAGTYQLVKYQQALAAVRCRDVAVDIGGHVGLWARVMAQDFDKVVSFEPCPPHIECFALNTAEMPNVRLIEAALSDKNETLRIEFPADNTGHSHVVRRGGDYVAAAYRLDDVPELLPAGRIGFIKIDVEGYELQVVAGARETIMRHKPVVLIEQKKQNAERYGKDRYAALMQLRSWGMTEVCVMNGDHLLTWPSPDEGG